MPPTPDAERDEFRGRRRLARRRRARLLAVAVVAAAVVLGLLGYWTPFDPSTLGPFVTSPLPPIHPTVAGPEDAPAIVFLHGMALTREMWQPQMQALADEFRVISLDLPGHGELAATRYSLEGACDVVEQVVRREAKGRALIVGLSMGGYTALEFAHRHPDLTSGIVLASCSAEGRGPLAFPYRLAAWIAGRPTVRWLDAVNLTFMRLTIPRPFVEPMLQSGSYAAATPDVVATIADQDWAPKLAAYPHPVLILNGWLDLGFRKDEKRWLAATKDGRLHVIPWAGHLSNMHRPALFTKALRDFAREATRPTEP